VTRTAAMQQPHARSRMIDATCQLICTFPTLAPEIAAAVSEECDGRYRMRIGKFLAYKCTLLILARRVKTSVMLFKNI
jgi:hypothetical protein